MPRTQDISQSEGLVHLFEARQVALASQGHNKRSRGGCWQTRQGQESLGMCTVEEAAENLRSFLRMDQSHDPDGGEWMRRTRTSIERIMDEREVTSQVFIEAILLEGKLHHIRAISKDPSWARDVLIPQEGMAEAEAAELLKALLTRNWEVEEVAQGGIWEAIRLLMSYMGGQLTDELQREFIEGHDQEFFARVPKVGEIFCTLECRLYMGRSVFVRHAGSQEVEAFLEIVKWCDITVIPSVTLIFGG